MITYTSVHDIIKAVLTQATDLNKYSNALYNDYVSYMASMNVSMNADESTTNRNLVIYLANFFNFLEQTGYMKITMQTMLKQDELKAHQDKIVDDFFNSFDKYTDPKMGLIYKIYGVGVTEANKDKYAQIVKSYGMQFVKDMQPTLKVTTSYSYNGGMLNPTKKADADFSSPLSAGLISKMELNQLAQNIVFEMLDTAKVKSYGNVAELSAICSSSSSSSSCSFIAYMKLA